MLNQIDIVIVKGIMIPFIGTALGSSLVLFMRGELKGATQKSLTGFAAGVMVAASIWSLLIPSMEQAKSMGRLSFIPAFIGFWLGTCFLLLLDRMVPHLHMNASAPEGPECRLGKSAKMLLALAIHNIPEGMAVGVVYAGILSGNTNITIGGAMALSVGMAIQNFPEGAIISMPLHGEGMSKQRAVFYGILSGIVEPIAGFIMIFAASFLFPVMPYLLAFAGGSMIYVVVEELIPEMSEGEHSNIGVVFFSLGFTLMMALDVALG